MNDDKEEINTMYLNGNAIAWVQQTSELLSAQNITFIYFFSNFLCNAGRQNFGTLNLDFGTLEFRF